MENLLLKNGIIFEMIPPYKPRKADIFIENKKIKKVGINLDESLFPNVKTIDLNESFVFPGFIDSHCHIGIFETGIGPMGVDGNESSDPITPQLRAIDGVNPFDKEFKHAYEHGITCVATGPGSSNPIGGIFAALKTYGETYDDMIINDTLAMKVAFGENPKNAFGGKSLSPMTRMGIASLIREAFFETIEYIEKRKTNSADFNLKYEMLAKVVNHEIPLKAHCHRADDILTALRVAKEFALDITLDHCSEGHLIANQLSYAKGVIIGPLLEFPHKNENMNQSAEAAKIYLNENILFSIMSDLPASHCNSIIKAARDCVNEGLPLIEAYKAITINAATLLDLDERLGSIEVGKDADIVVFDYNPIDNIYSKCILTIIDGRIIHNLH